MNCCNHDCRQGRDCPARDKGDEALSMVMWTLALFAVFALIAAACAGRL